MPYGMTWDEFKPDGYSSSDWHDGPIITPLNQGRNQMNDYEMMNQRVDNLRLELYRLNQKKENLQYLIDDVMAELLDTRRQITREDIRRNTRLEGESSPAPVDLDFIY